MVKHFWKLFRKLGEVNYPPLHGAPPIPPPVSPPNSPPTILDVGTLSVVCSGARWMPSVRRPENGEPAVLLLAAIARHFPEGPGVLDLAPEVPARVGSGS